MTTSDALRILDSSDLMPVDGQVVRWSDDSRIGDDSDIAEVEEAADLLGYDVIENDDGDLELSDRS